MTPARFQTIEEIFLAALEQEPDQVSAFLDTACEGDAVLRREVEALLASRSTSRQLYRNIKCWSRDEDYSKSAS